MYDIVKEVLAKGATTEILTDTAVLNSLVDVYEILLETSLLKAIAPEVLRATVKKAEGNSDLLISDLDGKVVDKNYNKCLNKT